MQARKSKFANLLDRGIIMFLDDILVYSHRRDKHAQLLHMVFDKLREHCFYCKFKKCSFFCTTNTFLGFNITSDGLRISNAKAKN